MHYYLTIKILVILKEIMLNAILHLAFAFPQLLATSSFLTFQLYLTDIFFWNSFLEKCYYSFYLIYYFFAHLS